MVDPSSIPLLVPLFAPYCGGVARQQDLMRALQVLAMGCLQGQRPLNDGGSHAYELQWTGEPAPLETLSCQLRFPDLPAIQYNFALPCHQLVQWLMESPGLGLPESFWPWLLQGRTAGAPT